MFAGASSIIRGSLHNIFEYSRSYDVVLYDTESFFGKICVVGKKCFRNEVKRKIMDEEFRVPSFGSGFPKGSKKNEVRWEWHGGNLRQLTRYKSGVFLVRASFGGKNFAKSYLKNVEECGMLAWGSDQLGLYETVEAVGLGGKIGNLPQSHIDWQLNLKSKIWVGKGPRKNSCKFCAEEFKRLRSCGASVDGSCFHNCSLGRRPKAGQTRFDFLE
jgi:hypothetical protein